MAFYKIGERKNRPGVYLRFVDRGKDAGKVAAAPAKPEPPDLTDELIVEYRAGVVTLMLPIGCTVAYDGEGTVTLSGLESVAYEDDGIVTIGG